MSKIFGGGIFQVRWVHMRRWDVSVTDLLAFQVLFHNVSLILFSFLRKTTTPDKGSALIFKKKTLSFTVGRQL